VYPKEIETYIDEIDGVQESAVIGVPDPDFGERVTAVVVHDPERMDITGEMIIASLRQCVANYKVPKQVLFMPELPRNAMGKVQKNALRDAYGQSAG
jgi:malonyl-CoA/methylmalonyl-CoA synthetase